MKFYKTKKITIIPDKLFLEFTLYESWCKESSGTLIDGKVVPFKDDIPTYFFPLMGLRYEYFNGNNLLANGISITLFGCSLSIDIRYYRNV